MKRILLTIGPRGAGKSTFCREIEKKNLPNVTYAGRDEFLVERYGKNVWDPYCFSLSAGEQVFLSHVSDLAKNNDAILLECFFCYKNNLLVIKDKFIPRDDACTEFMREIGLTDYLFLEEKEKNFSFEALFFTTPPDICAQQFIDREYPNESERMRSFYYQRAFLNSVKFNEEAKKFNKYFDVVWEINPLQSLIFPIENILGLV